MESPPSGSTWLEAFPSSDDSGLLLTSGSISSSSGEGCHCTLAMELQDSDDDGKSLSHEGSLDYSDGMSCENFNTLKKGPGWPEFYSFENGCDGKLVPIDPPPEFQDSPPLSEVYQTVPGKNMLVGQCLQIKSISRVGSESERRYIEKFSGKFVKSILAEALSISCKVTWSIHCSQDCHPLECELGKVGPSASPRLCWTPELPLVPRTCPGSRASPASPLSRNSPSVVVHDIPPRSESHAGEIGDVYNVPFDSDVYAVPVDVVRPVERADGGASVPLVTTSRKATQPPQRPGRRHLRKRRRHLASGSRTEADRHATTSRSHPGPSAPGKCVRVPSPTSPTSPQTESSNKRHSVPGPGSSPVPQAATTARCQGGGRSSGGGRKGRSSTESRSAVGEPIHMTLQEVRQYLRNLYSGTGGGRGPGRGVRQSSREGGASSTAVDSSCGGDAQEAQAEVDSVDCKAPGKSRSSHAVGNGKVVEGNPTSPVSRGEGSCNRPSSSTSGSRHGFSTNLRQTLCSIFRLRRMPSSPGRRHARRAVSSTSSGTTTLPAGSEGASGGGPTDSADPELNLPPPPPPPFTGRALPPLPLNTSADGIANRPPAPIPEGAISPLPEEESRAGEAEDPLVAVADEPSMDFASSIEKVKDYGWYWGPISGEAAEKILSNEPDGSFIVRDSSDDHYIFSLTFKLNGCVRHVRIEHDQGNFSFGSCTKFKSHTIVDFIENAVEHSRSGRYLFFLHRRPVLGPMRVQLLHPVSRFKQVQSLQHMCRFVILKVVRRDLIQTLPLPRRIIDYLSTPHYYSEQPLEEERSGSSGASGAGSPGGEGLARAAAATASTTPIIVPPTPPSPNHLPPHGPS